MLRLRSCSWLLSHRVGLSCSHPRALLDEMTQRGLKPDKVSFAAAMQVRGMYGWCDGVMVCHVHVVAVVVVVLDVALNSDTHCTTAAP